MLSPNDPITNLTAAQSDFLLRRLLDYSPDVIYFKDLQSRFILINKAAAKCFNLESPEAARGKTDFDIFTQEHASAAFADEQEIIRTGNPIIGKEEIETWPDGTRTWATSTKLPLQNTKGEIIGTFGISRNITDRIHAIEQIAEQAALIDIAPDAIMVCDMHSNILFWNKGAERVYGWTSQEALGKSAIELLYPETNHAQCIEIITAVVGLGAWKGEVQHVTKDGKQRIIESQRTLLRDNKNCPKSVLIINTDITEKKHIEAQFMRAQRLESIGTLAGGIAHDLNNILAPIILAVELLKTTTQSTEANSIITAIEASAKRGASIVKQVLSFARGIEGDRTEIQTQNILHEITQILADTFPKNIQIIGELSHTPWTIVGDATQIQQVLVNLCVNARDAMPNGGTIRITIDNIYIREQDLYLNPHAKPGPYTTLSISDTGTGIRADTLDKIFEPFFTTKALGQGTGLGLSTSLGIIKSHGGFINVNSTVGQGTTFNVYLPAKPIPQQSASQAIPIVLPRGQQETVLVVDDEETIRSITSQTLQAFGYNVLTAANGIEALAIHEKDPQAISITITDMAMPIMDGLQTIMAIRTLNPLARIIATSGNQDPASTDKLRSLGVQHTLLKPYTTRTLLEVLRIALDAPIPNNCT